MAVRREFPLTNHQRHLRPALRGPCIVLSSSSSSNLRRCFLIHRATTNRSVAAPPVEQRIFNQSPTRNRYSPGPPTIREGPTRRRRVTPKAHRRSHHLSACWTNRSANRCQIRCRCARHRSKANRRRSSARTGRILSTTPPFRHHRRSKVRSRRGNPDRVVLEVIGC